MTPSVSEADADAKSMEQKRDVSAAKDLETSDSEWEPRVL
jgi:hypothetical protein